MGIAKVGTHESLLNRVRAFRERFGTVGALSKSLDVVLQKAFRTNVYTVVWLERDSLAELAPPDPRFTFRFLTADEVARFAADPQHFIDPGFADRVRKGHSACFAALAEEQLAAIGCFSLECSGPEQAGGVAMSYPPDVAYLAYGYTHRDFRGARLHGLIMALGLQELARRGVTKLVSLVGWTNWASLKSCWRLGYVHVGNMLVFHGPKRAYGLYPTAAKRLGIRFGRKAAQRA